jgi:hypothetical protein
MQDLSLEIFIQVVIMWNDDLFKVSNSRGPSIVYEFQFHVDHLHAIVYHII